MDQKNALAQKQYLKKKIMGSDKNLPDQIPELEFLDMDISSLDNFRESWPFIW